MRRSRTGRSGRTVLVVAIACVLAAILLPSLPLLILGGLLFLASLAVAYLDVRRAGSSTRSGITG